jgi:hypothetical protein
MPTSRTSATLRVFRDGGSAAAVTDVLGIQPSMSHDAGEPRSPRDPRPWPHAMWALDSPRPDTDGLDAHLAWLCDRLAGCVQGLRHLRTEGYRLDFFCFVEVLNGQGGVSINPDVITQLGRLPVELVVDIYASSGDE